MESGWRGGKEARGEKGCVRRRNRNNMKGERVGSFSLLHPVRIGLPFSPYSIRLSSIPYSTLCASISQSVLPKISYTSQTGSDRNRLRNLYLVDYVFSFRSITYTNKYIYICFFSLAFRPTLPYSAHSFSSCRSSKPHAPTPASHSPLSPFMLKNTHIYTVYFFL